MSMIPEQIKLVGDGLSIVTVSATLMTWLPPVAALLTIIWSAIRIYETKTVRKMFGHKRTKRTRKSDK